MSLVKLPERKARSRMSFIDVLRLHMDIAFSENLTYLEITYRTDRMDKPNSISISAPPEIPPGRTD